MFRNNKPAKAPHKTVNLIFMDGGLGDHIGSLVATNYILTQYPWINLLIWVPDYMLEFSKHVLPRKASVRNYTNMQHTYDRDLPTKTTKWDGHTSSMKIHLVDYAFLKLCDENPATEHKNYLQVKPLAIPLGKFKLPKDYVVITTGYTAEVREFPANHINGVAAYLRGRGITPVFLGQAQTKTGGSHVIEGSFSDQIDYTGGVNLIDKTNLVQAAHIMGQAKAVLGVDNGLLHLAGCTQVPIVGGFTTVSPETRFPIRNSVLGWNYYTVVPDMSLECRFCQERTNFLYGHDYRHCLYKDNLCTTQMTAEKFIDHLKKIL